MRTLIRLIVTLVAFTAVLIPFGLSAEAASTLCRPAGAVDNPGEKLLGQPPLTKEQLAKKTEVKQGRDEFAKLAKELGVSEARLDAALRNVKIAMGKAAPKGKQTRLSRAIVTRFANELGISRHRARQILTSLFIADGGGSPTTKPKDPAAAKAAGACS